MLKCHAGMKENAARVQVQVPKCMHKAFLIKKIIENTTQYTQSHEHRLKIDPLRSHAPLSKYKLRKATAYDIAIMLRLQTLDSRL